MMGIKVKHEFGQCSCQATTNGSIVQQQFDMLIDQLKKYLLSGQTT
jgi:hypothetical protein